MTGKSKTFCILPFMHIQVKPNGQIKPCCRFDFTHNEYINKDRYLKGESFYHTFNRYNISNGSTLTEAMTSDLWEDVRNKMLVGDKVSGCRKCYTEESRHSKSMRINENYLRNGNIQDRLSDKVEPLKIKYLEMTFGNYCNLKCRTCAADLSSTWYDEEILLAKHYPGRYPAPKILNIPFNWQADDFKFVEEIKFTGGEPMIHPDFLKFMNMLIDNGYAKNISLDVFTNCSWKPGEKFLSRLEKFKQVHISLSIDGIGKTNDYIRTPSKWEIVDQTVDGWLYQEAKNLEKFQISWNPTINIYNILEIDKMLDWWSDKQNTYFVNRSWPNLNEKYYREEYNASSFRLIFNILQDPKYLAISNLPLSAKTIVNDKIKGLLDKHDCYDMTNPRKETFYKKLMAIKGALSSEGDSNMLNLFASYTQDLDKIRNQSIKESIPILYDILNGQVEYIGKL